MEPWLQPEDELVAPQVRDLHTSLQQALYWARQHLEVTPEEVLWWEPAPGVPSIGARIQHLIRSSQRLAAYAFDPAADPEQLAAHAAQDWLPSRCSKQELLQELEATFRQLQEQLRRAEPEALQQPCFVGRKRLPVRRSTLVHHIAEHASYHAGQLIVLLRLWQAQHRT